MKQGWNSWREAAVMLREQQRMLSGAANRMRNRALSAGWNKWRAEVAERRQQQRKYLRS